MPARDRSPSRWPRALAAALLGSSLGFGGTVSTVHAGAPEFGEQTALNRYEMTHAEIYTNDFEDSDALGNTIEIIAPNAVLTDDPALVISGARSLRLDGDPAIVRLQADTTGLRPNTIYEVVLRYRLLGSDTGIQSFFAAGFSWSGFPDGEWSGGVLESALDDSVDDPARVWEYRRAIMTNDATDIALYLGVFHGADVVIDDLSVRRRDASLLPARPPLPRAGFPRLGNYSLFSALDSAHRNAGIDIEEVYSTLGLFDVLTGYGIDHTLGVSDAGQRLRAVNPDIILLPYFQAFVYQDRPSAPANHAAGLLSRFNDGIPAAWFMRNPAGETLEEPNFPGNFQLNHTHLGASVNGERFPEYAADFLTRSVLPSGAWDGIHFDQAEWYPNPLLGEGNAFLNQDIELPPIDIDEDGIADSDAFLYTTWEKAFEEYFDALAERFGHTQILFGNAGELPVRPAVIRRLNGYMREFTSPYPIYDDGSWATDFPSGWYELMERYRLVGEFLRAPQLPIFQFTGYKLGTPDPGATENGLERRLQELEPRDFRRMRLGLTSVLLGDGYFGYDYIDNTTAPVWFDEYAVGSDGRPVKSVAGKGYLGQPLGAAAEIPIDAELVFEVGFESVPELPLGFYLGQYLEYTQDPAAVSTGTGAVVIDTRPLEPTLTNRLVLLSSSLQYPLEVGETYHLSADYRVLDYDPENFGEPLAVIDRGLSTGEPLPSGGASAAIWDAEPGLNGSLRAVFVADRTDTDLNISMTDRGRVAFDNIRLHKGAGGVFRRDFENGVVLVNPTPEALTVSQAEIAGPLARSGLRRILGTQDPTVNDGSAVTDGLTLGPADGIILLADRIPAPPPGRPTGLFVAPGSDACDINWAPASGTVAGYLLRYGLAGGDLTRFAMSPAGVSGRIEGLEPGSSYTVEVTAYDYLGNPGPASPAVQCQTSGAAAGARPVIDGSFVLAPGSFVQINGSGFSDGGGFVDQPPFPLALAGTEVLVNGVAVPLAAVEPDRITFIAPNALGGSQAIVEVRREGLASASHFNPVAVATPYLWTWDGTDYGIAFHAGNFAPLTAEDPARPGDRAVLLVSGTGAFEPPAADGEYPVPGSKAAAAVAVDVGGTEVVGTVTPAPWFGFSLLEFEMPTGLSGGVASITARVGGVPSNSAIIVTGAAP